VQLHRRQLVGSGFRGWWRAKQSAEQSPCFRLSMVSLRAESIFGEGARPHQAILPQTLFRLSINYSSRSTVSRLPLVEAQFAARGGNSGSGAQPATAVPQPLRGGGNARVFINGAPVNAAWWTNAPLVARLGFDR
jgi:hypothetical protein